MRLEELRWFVRLAETGHVTRTAEELHLSQPAVSRALRRVEEDLRTELFHRVGRRLVLNSYGEILYAHATRAIGELDAARARMDAIRDSRAGAIDLSFVTSFGTWLIPWLVREYQAVAPTAAFTLRGGPADSVVSAVRDGVVACGITSPEPAGDDLSWTPLVDEELGLALPSGHPLAERETVRPQEVDQLPMVALRRDFGLRQISDAYFGRFDASPYLLMEATDIGTVQGLVASGTGVGVLPVHRGSQPGIVVLPFEGVPLLRTAGLLIDSHRPHPAHVGHFITFAVSRHDGLHVPDDGLRLPGEDQPPA